MYVSIHTKRPLILLHFGNEAPGDQKKKHSHAADNAENPPLAIYGNTSKDRVSQDTEEIKTEEPVFF